MTSEPPAVKVGRLRRAFTLAVRGAFVLLTIGLGLYTIQTFGELMRGSSGGERPRTPPPAPVADLVEPTVPDGGWSIAGQPFRLRNENCSDQRLNEVLDRPPAADVPDGAIDETLMQIVRQRGRRSEVAGFRAYAMDETTRRVRVYTRSRDGGERWLLARIAIRDSSGGWLLTEATPVAGPAMKA